MNKFNLYIFFILLLLFSRTNSQLVNILIDAEDYTSKQNASSCEYIIYDGDGAGYVNTKCQNQQWTEESTLSGFIGDSYMRLLPIAGLEYGSSSGPRINYDFSITKSSYYEIFAHTTSVSHYDRRAFYSIYKDGELLVNYNRIWTATNGRFVWSRIYDSLFLEVGSTYTLVFSMQYDGFALDAINVQEIACIAQCTGKNCGDDGCGGICGSCADTDICSDTGICICDGCSLSPMQPPGNCNLNYGSNRMHRFTTSNFPWPEQDWTVEFWSKGGDGAVLYYHEPEGFKKSFGIFLGYDHKNFLLTIKDEENSYNPTDSLIIDTSWWTHFTITYSSTTATPNLKIYIQKQYPGEASRDVVSLRYAVSSKWKPGGTLSFGQRPTPTRWNWGADKYVPYEHGARRLFDDIRIWNYSRTINEVELDREQLLDGTEYGLVGYWNFEDLGDHSSTCTIYPYPLEREGIDTYGLSSVSESGFQTLYECPFCYGDRNGESKALYNLMLSTTSDIWYNTKNWQHISLYHGNYGQSRSRACQLWSSLQPFGVSCHNFGANEGTRITEINLAYNNLLGTLPESFEQYYNASVENYNFMERISKNGLSNYPNGALLIYYRDYQYFGPSSESSTFRSLDSFVNNDNKHSPSMSQISKVYVDWKTGCPIFPCSTPEFQDSYSTVILTKVTIPQSGDWKFYVRSDDQSKIWIDGNFVGYRYSDIKVTNLTKDQTINVRIEHLEGLGNAWVILYWKNFPFTCTSSEWDNSWSTGYDIVPSKYLELWDDADEVPNLCINCQKWYVRYDFEDAANIGKPDMGNYNLGDAVDLTLEPLGSLNVVVDSERGNVHVGALGLGTTETEKYLYFSDFSASGYFRCPADININGYYPIFSIDPTGYWQGRVIYVGVHKDTVGYWSSNRNYLKPNSEGMSICNGEWIFFGVAFNAKKKTLTLVTDDNRGSVYDIEIPWASDDHEYILQIGSDLVVDDITFYKTALTSSEIQSLRENGNRFLKEEEKDVSWQNAVDYCKLQGKQLCFAGQWCKTRENNLAGQDSQYEPLFTYPDSGDISPWTPVADSENEWIYIGENNLENQCETYSDLEIIAKGSLPITSITSPAVRCCVDATNSLLDRREEVDPNFFNKLDRLRYVYLQSNELRGTLPDSIKNSADLSHIYLDSNKFESEIPKGINQLKYLEKLSISDNNFSGNLEFGISNLKYLQQIATRKNSFSGRLPQDLEQSNSLQNIDFSHNKFSGDTPSGILNSNTLKFINISSNELSGTVPDRDEKKLYCTSLNHGIYNNETEKCECISPYDGDYCQLVWFEFPTIINSENERLEWVASLDINNTCEQCDSVYPKYIHYGYYDSTKATTTSWINYKREGIRVYDVKPGIPSGEGNNACLEQRGLYRGNIDGSSASVIRSNLAEGIRCIESAGELYGFRTYKSMWILTDWLPIYFQDFEVPGDASNWQTISAKKRSVTSIKDYDSMVGNILGGNEELGQNSAIETNFDLSAVEQDRVKVNFRMIPVETQPGEEIKVFANDKLVKTIKYDTMSHNLNAQTEEFKNNLIGVNDNLVCHLSFENSKDPSSTISSQGINFDMIGSSKPIGSKWNKGWYLDSSYFVPENTIDLNNGAFTAVFQMKFPLEIKLTNWDISFFLLGSGTHYDKRRHWDQRLGLHRDGSAIPQHEQTLQKVFADGLQSLTLVGEPIRQDAVEFIHDHISMEKNLVYQNLATESTVTGWFKASPNIWSYQYIYLHGSKHNYYSMSCFLYQGKLYFRLSTTLAHHDWISSLTYSDGDWHFLAIFHDINSIAVYVDNVFIGGADTATYPGKIVPDYTVHLGTSVTTFHNLNGAIDDFRIFNKKLDAAEIHNAYYYETESPNDDWEASKVLQFTFEVDYSIEGEHNFEIKEESSYSFSGYGSGLYVSDPFRGGNVFETYKEALNSGQTQLTKIYVNGKYFDYIPNVAFDFTSLSNSHWFGDLYDFKLYNKSLTSEELNQIEWGIEPTEHEIEIVDNSDNLKLKFQSNSVESGDFSWGIDNVQISVSSSVQPRLLSYRKPVTASSEHSSSYAANRVNDGTIFSYTGGVFLLAKLSAGFVTIDLGSAKDIRYIRFLNSLRPTHDDIWRTKDWRLGVSNNNVDFIQVDSGTFDVKGYSDIEDEDWYYYHTLSTEFNYRYVRFYIDSWYNWGGGLIELEVYGFEKEIFPTRTIDLSDNSLSCKLPSFLFRKDSDDLDFALDLSENIFWCPLTGISAKTTIDTCEQILISELIPNNIDLVDTIPASIEVNLYTTSGLVDFLSNCEFEVYCSYSDKADGNQSITAPLSLDSTNNKVYCKLPSPLEARDYILKLTNTEGESLTSNLLTLDVKYSCPNDCSGKGLCLTTTGICQCFPPAGGSDCSQTSCPSDCNSDTGNGVCDTTTGVCVCACSTRCPDPDYTGVSCSIPDIDCPLDCSSSSNQGTCNRVTGKCICKSGFWGGFVTTDTGREDRENDCSWKVCPPNNEPYCSYDVDETGVEKGGNCNGVTGDCECFLGWGGSSCSNAILNCPDDCNGNGNCDFSTGICACFRNSKGNYFTGESCDQQLCSNNCSDAGTCDLSTGECTCDTNYIGDDCSISDFECLNGCTGNGDCNRQTGSCSCNAGYENVDCSHLTCPGFPSQCSSASSQGYCNTTSGVCICTDAWIGSFCQIPDLDCPDDCFSNVSRGFCNRQSGTCICGNQFLLPNCEFKSCPNDCSENGECQTTNGTCICNEEWKGIDCSIQDLNCENCNEENGGGYCNGNTGRCICNSGFKTDILEYSLDSEEINVTDLDALLEELLESYDPPLVCSLKICPGDGTCGFPDHGYCDKANGTCVCNEHRLGEDCSIANFLCEGGCNEPAGICNLETGNCSCGGKYEGKNCDLISCPNDCSESGVCEGSTGVCDCYDRFVGADCSQKLCPGDGFCGQIEKKGICDRSTGVCQCLPQDNGVSYGGQDCSLLLCQNNCSSNGICNTETGTCTCDQGWTLSDCSQVDLDCPGNCSISSRGQCDRTTGLCSCFAPWNEPDCSSRDCVLNCGQQGVCNGTTGECDCKENYIGVDCSIANFQCESDCTMPGISTGECDITNGQCRCFNGYGGDKCVDRTCESFQMGDNIVTCSDNGVCNPNTGVCICNNTESYGQVCQYTHCPSNCTKGDTAGGLCDKSTGRCSCFSGFDGSDCSLKTCPSNCGENGVCDTDTGTCICDDSWEGKACHTEVVNTGMNILVILLTSSASIAGGAFGFILWRKKMIANLQTKTAPGN